MLAPFNGSNNHIAVARLGCAEASKPLSIKRKQLVFGYAARLNLLPQKFTVRLNHSCAICFVAHNERVPPFRSSADVNIERLNSLIDNLGHTTPK